MKTGLAQDRSAPRSTPPTNGGDGNAKTMAEPSANCCPAWRRRDCADVALDRTIAAAAVKHRNLGEEQFEVIVQLGHRADGGARSSDRAALIDGDGRRDALDAFDVRLIHAVEKLPRVGGKALDVAALTLGVQNVETPDVDLPEPLTPVTTVRALRGISISRSLRLFCLAPRMWMHLPFSGRGVTEDCSDKFPLPGRRLSLQAILFH